MNDNPIQPRTRTLTPEADYKRLAIHHVTLPPGARSSVPHAESAEEEFVFVLRGEPHAWINGWLTRLKTGSAAVFAAGTGIAHSFLNNTGENVELLVVGERTKKENRWIYPVNPELREKAGAGWWSDAPVHPLGPHNGRPGPVRTEDLAATPPPCLVFAPALERKGGFHYPGDNETFGTFARFSSLFNLQRLGLSYETLAPGRRSSWPHAHRAEEEFAYILAGTAKIWLNGEIQTLGPGDAAPFVAGSGVAHCIINDTTEPLVYLMIGEAIDDPEDRLFYPRNPLRDEEGRRYGWYWHDRPAHPIGDHHGRPERPFPNHLQLQPMPDDFPCERFTVLRDGAAVGQVRLFVKDPTACDIQSETNFDDEIKALIEHYLKNARRIDDVRWP